MGGRTHFIGIGGIGMSALARIFLARGELVSGSDVRETALTRQLRNEGAEIFIGHRPENIGDARCVVLSTAIANDNPEAARARTNGCAVLRRGEMLAQLMRGARGIAIAGTHGKTTTTAMAAAILIDAQLDPTIVIGGEWLNTGTNARVGAGEWFLTEADESDGSFLELEPQFAVVTNIENDHIATAEQMVELRQHFQTFLERLPGDGLAIVGIDNPDSAQLTTSGTRARIETFGLAAGARLRATDLRFAGLGSRFTVVAEGTPVGEVELRVPGAINVVNALGAMAVGRALDVPFETSARALRGFSGVRRRFEILARSPRMTVVDDYAHHPTAVKATIEAARGYFEGPIVVAFQPHRFTRTAYLAREFAGALRGADLVFLTPVYAASEPPIPGVDERSIGEPLRSSGARVEYAAAVEDLPDLLLEHAPPGALVLMLGAGSISGVAAQLAARIGAERATA